MPLKLPVTIGNLNPATSPAYLQQSDLLVIERAGLTFKTSISPATFNIVNVATYGASPTASASVNTAAFYAASQALVNNGGGTLVIPFGNYTVGTQIFAGATGLGYAYQAQPVIELSGCTGVVVIEGNGATLTVANGLRYGSFNPVTGAPYVSSPGFTNPDYAASVGRIIDAESCYNVVVNDLSINGNIPNLIIGGVWGDTGIQLPATAFFADPAAFTVNNCNFYNNGLDGIQTQGSIVTNSAPIQQFVVNTQLTGNGRNNMSLVADNQFTGINVTMNNAGRTVNIGTGMAFGSSPQAGCDIEPNTGLTTYNIKFINSQFSNNTGAGLLSPYSASYNVGYINCDRCLFIGTTNWSLWPANPYMSFTNCTIVGAAVNIYGNMSNPEQSSKFYNCLFTDDVTLSPTGATYGPYQDFGSCINVLFDACQFVVTQSGNSLPFVSSPTNIFNNCNWNQSPSTATAVAFAGTFTGVCTVNSTGTLDYGSGNQYFGELTVNATKIIQTNTFYPLASTTLAGIAEIATSTDWYANAINSTKILPPSAIPFANYYAIGSGTPAWTATNEYILAVTQDPFAGGAFGNGFLTVNMWASSTVNMSFTLAWTFNQTQRAVFTVSNYSVGTGLTSTWSLAQFLTQMTFSVYRDTTNQGCIITFTPAVNLMVANSDIVITSTQSLFAKNTTFIGQLKSTLTDTLINGQSALPTTSQSISATFTPTLVGWTNVGTPTVTGNYTQNGNSVTYSISVIPSTSISTTAGTSTITGLPLIVGAVSYPAQIVDTTAITSVGEGVSTSAGSTIRMPTISTLTHPIIISGIYNII